MAVLEVDGRTDFNHYPDYLDCKCGRSSRWYTGITITENLKGKFTCIFCLSGLEEGSLYAIMVYGALGSKQRFFKEQE